DATGRGLAIRDSAVKVAGQRISLDGSIAVKPKTIMLDFRMDADRIDGGKLVAALAHDRPSDGAKAGPWSVPVEGRVALTARSIALGEGVGESVAGTVRLEPKGTVVELSKASLCAISVPLNATFAPDGATVTGRIATRGAELDTVLPCLFPGRDLEGSGRLDVDAEYAASGPTAELLHRLRGSFLGTARAGRGRYTPLGPQSLALTPRPRAPRGSGGGRTRPGPPSRPPSPPGRPV